MNEDQKSIGRGGIGEGRRDEYSIRYNIIIVV